MTTLFDATRPVKTTRRFAAGLVATRPTYRADHTAADEAWLAEDNARREAAARDRHYDAAADEARALDALCLGLVAA
jgi:hypothetical protein